MRRLLLFLPAVSLLLAIGCSGGDDASGPSTPAESSGPVRSHLDCGSNANGSERALRQFVAILRTGDETRIRAVLADRGRFFALSVNGDRPSGPHLGVRGNPDKAARAVARRGGLPLEIVRFMNSEAPNRSTDFGFIGRWSGTRRVVGKAAIDCTQGKVIVLAAGVRRR